MRVGSFRNRHTPYRATLLRAEVVFSFDRESPLDGLAPRSGRGRRWPLREDAPATVGTLPKSGQSRDYFLTFVFILGGSADAHPKPRRRKAMTTKRQAASRLWLTEKLS